LLVEPTSFVSQTEVYTKEFRRWRSKEVVHSLRQRVPEELANYLDPIAKHLAEEVNEISDYLRTEVLNE
jgi:hypothetical protein